MDNDTLNVFLRALQKYEAITMLTGYNRNTNPMSSVNLDHSSLLRRLINGEPIYKYPPPQAMSYPWYSIFEQTVHPNCTVGIYDEGDKQHVSIEQCGQWKLIELIEAPDKVLIAEYVGPYKLRVKATEHGQKYINFTPYTVVVLEHDNEVVEYYHVAKLPS